MRKGYIDTPDGQIHYRTAGERGPLLFCLHESPLSSWEFERALPLLGARCRAVAFDTPGYGLSDPPPAPIDIAGYARRLLPAIESFGEERFAFAAVHTGTSIALELIVQHLAERTTHAIFSGVPMIAPDQVEGFLARIGEPAMDADGAFLARTWETRRNNWGEDTDLAMIHDAVAQQLAVYSRFHWAFRAVFAYDARAALQRLACPVHILNAAGDSLAAIDREAARLVAGARLTLVEGVGGQLPYRAPERYAREVLAFLGV